VGEGGCAQCQRLPGEFFLAGCHCLLSLALQPGGGALQLAFLHLGPLAGSRHVYDGAADPAQLLLLLGMGVVEYLAGVLRTVQQCVHFDFVQFGDTARDAHGDPPCSSAPLPATISTIPAAVREGQGLWSRCRGPAGECS
jgi:hypothetical protein